MTIMKICKTTLSTWSDNESIRFINHETIDIYMLCVDRDGNTIAYVNCENGLVTFLVSVDFRVAKDMSDSIYYSRL